MPEPRVALCRVLGPARVTIGDAAAPAELLWRKHLALLVYLACSPRRSRTRDHLVGLLWSDRDEPQARHSLSEALRVFRRALGNQGIAVDVDQVRLAADAVKLDCDRFAELHARGEWKAAAALVEGEFLEGLAIPEANEFETWLANQRALWRTRAVEALVNTVAADVAAGDTAAAGHAGLRAVGLDPTSESAGRAAMRALALAGDRGGALRVADALVRSLRDALGTGPSHETERLVERIREARIGRRVLAGPPAARPRPPLCGRSAELASLVSTWDRAQRGRGQVALVEAEPGEGKTRLIEELSARARLDDATVVTARAVPADRTQACSDVAGLLLGGLGEAPGLASAPSPALAALVTLAPELGDRFPEVGSPASVGEAVRAAVLAVTDERPVLLALDDAQWCDPDTLATLPALARDISARRVLMVLGIERGAADAQRFDDMRERIGRDLEGTVLRLERLDTAALRQLAAWALPTYSVPELDRLTRRVEHETAGIPLLAVGLLEAVALGFALAPDSPAWPSPKRTLVDSLPHELPPAAVGAICLRYGRLQASTQAVLAAAAALGGRTGPDVLAAATGHARADVDAALDLLEWERWLVADPRGYVFTAPIVRSILLREMITPGQAQRYRQRPNS
jgi:DNA-binding SARP family transcriptional activator